MFITVENPNVAAENIYSDLLKISRWAHILLVKFNSNKNEVMLISRKTKRQAQPPVFMQNQQIQEVEFPPAWTRLNIMRKLKFDLDQKSLETVYISFIRSILEYADVSWDNCSQQEKQELEKTQIEAARIATGSTKLVSV